VPSLEELKSKWFLYSAKTPSFPPTQRHEGSSVRNWTDGNLCTFLIDGKAYMKVWHDLLAAMGRDGELYHAGWRFENVATLGAVTAPSSGALDLVLAADKAGVSVYGMMDRSALTIVYNTPTMAWLRLHAIFTVVLDNRFPPRGSNHQKFACMKNPASPAAVLGSIDISKTRWDDPAHASKNPDRDPRFGKETHDTGVQIQGPAVADVESTFRERWNDSTRTWGLEPLAPPLALISTPLSAPRAAGTHSVQIVHTYGRTTSKFGYSWSAEGEFTGWASYLNALKTASTYIYIEDQYFLPFDWPPCFTRTGTLAQATDIIFQLGEAIKRGVKVAVVTPSNAEDSTHMFQKYQRDQGAIYLQGVASAASSGGDFVIASPNNGTDWIYVHSKLLIVDDEFVLIGSTNVGQRSMTFDGEMSAGIIDADNKFAKAFRMELWQEHLQAGLSGDPAADFTTFQKSVLSKSGRLRAYDSTSTMPMGHAKAITTVIDPYGGPPR
jgi:phosphatidylserine/phosphatidylglycerophosphate/cardiolipin synthase-like enzyme